MTEATHKERPRSSSNPAESLAQLWRWREKRWIARDQVLTATERMRRAARDAKAAGATGEQIAKAAGMSRQAVWQLMKDD